MPLMVIKQLILSPLANIKFNKQGEWALASMLSLCGRMSLFSCNLFSMKNEFYYIKKLRMDIYKTVNKDPGQARHLATHDLGPNCLLWYM